MASTKRKEVSSVSANREAGSKKRPRLDDSKKQKSEGLAEKKAKSSNIAPKPSKPPTISLVSNEQPAFPRGGANVLTPIERKQIRVQAERDVLIEQKRKNKKGLFDARDGDASSPDEQENTFDKVGKASKKSKSKVLSKTPKAHKRRAVEGLNYKKLPSATLLFGGSSLHAEDREITSLQQLHVNDVVRGHICNVADIGVFVKLCRGATAFVRVSNLSDSYLKDWKNDFKRDQSVTGRIISLDAESSRIQLSLKESVLKSDYVAETTFDDLKEGQIVTGKVAKVEEFGVFILVDNSANVRGLCHRSEIAERRIEDARKVFSEGDAVKAKVLKLEPDVRRVNFGLKAAYFGDDADGESEEEVDGDEDVDILRGGAEVENGDDDTGRDNFAGFDEDDSDEEESLQDGEALSMEQNGDTDSLTGDNAAKSDVEPTTKSTQLAGLQIGGFDWQGLSAQPTSKSPSAPSSDTEQPLKHKRKRKPTIQTDLTGDLDSNGPQSTDDYERLLLSEPDSSLLWLQYMAFHLDLGEIDTARQIGQRALKSISPIGQSESEKLNIWIALLNLENAYGDDDTIEVAFKEACQVNDAQEIHERLASIYIQSSKHDKADQLFLTMIKKFGSGDPKIWINYATFLFDTMKEPDRGRGLLSRALQTLPPVAHIDITAKFAALEFRSSAGLAERGRTIFEGLLDSFPKRVDLWNVLLDLEMQYGDGEDSGGAGGGDRNNQVRRLFERIFSGGETEVGAKRMKNKQAKFFFKRWLEFEEGVGDERRVEGVKRRAEEWVRSSQ